MSTVQSPLTNLGYNMVAWPKTNIQPLTLLYKTTNGVGSVDASVLDLFKIGNAAPPEIIKGDEAADIEGVATLTFDAKGGVNMLDWLLNKLNLGKLSADVTLNNSYEVKVSYLKVKQDKVNLLTLDTYISESKPGREKFNSFKQKLEDNELFVITNVAKSNDISITISEKNGKDINADATIKGIMEANLNASRKKDNSIELVYKTEEDKPVVFAFKAQQIIYEKKSFWKGEPAHFYLRDKTGVVYMSEADFPSIPLKEGNVLIEL